MTVTQAAPIPAPVSQPQQAPVPEEPVSAPSGYFIQVHSFRAEPLAQRALPKLKQNGFAPFVRRTDTGWYAVLTGPYGTFAEASEAASRLRDRGASPIIRHQ